MSTMKIGGMLALEEDSDHLSICSSLEHLEPEQMKGEKSKSLYYKALTKEKRVNRLLIHAEKVIYSGFILP